MIPGWLTVILIALTVHRVTRLITRDQIPLIAVPREAFVQRWGVYKDATDKYESISGKRTNIFMQSIAYLWECDWCMSVWVSTGIVVSTYHLIDERWWQWLLIAAASSSVTGLIAQREPE